MFIYKLIKKDKILFILLFQLFQVSSNAQVFKKYEKIRAKQVDTVSLSYYQNIEPNIKVLLDTFLIEASVKEDEGDTLNYFIFVSFTKIGSENYIYFSKKSYQINYIELTENNKLLSFGYTNYKNKLIIFGMRNNRLKNSKCANEILKNLILFNLSESERIKILNKNDLIYITTQFSKKYKL